MAELKIKSNDIGFYVNTGTEEAPVLKLMACLTDHGLDGQAAEMNGDSRCGIHREAGDITFTASFEGFFKKNPQVNEFSGETLLSLFQDKAVKQWTIKNADDSYYREFTAYISSYSESGSTNEFVTFSGELNVSGVIIDTPPAT